MICPLSGPIGPALSDTAIRSILVDSQAIVPLQTLITLPVTSSPKKEKGLESVWAGT